MGYPKTDLPEMQAFLKAYQAVFDTEGKVQPDATDENSSNWAVTDRTCRHR